MKIKFILLLLGLTATHTITAQKLSKEEALDLMANDTCECIKEKKIDPSDSMEQKEMALGLCLIKSFNAHKSKSRFFANKNLNDIEEVGEMVGETMSEICLNDFMSLFTSEEMVGFLEEDETIESNQQTASRNLSIEAQLTALKNDAISYIETKDDFDKTHTFLIIDEFEGYELLKKSNFGNSFLIAYDEREFFDLSERQYIIKKVITKIVQIN